MIRIFPILLVISIAFGALHVRMVLLGPPGVGKSYFAERFIHGRPSTRSKYSLAGDHHFKTLFMSDGTKIMLYLWDTSGQECHRRILPVYIAESRVIIAVYDLSDPNSYKECMQFLNSYESVYAENAIFILVGTKSDKLYDFHLTICNPQDDPDSEWVRNGFQRSYMVSSVDDCNGFEAMEEDLLQYIKNTL